MLSIFVLFASMFLISSSYTASPPSNYTWPQNTKNICFVGQFDLALNVDYMQTNGVMASTKIPLNNSTYESYIVSCEMPTNIHILTISMLSGLTNIILSFTIDANNITSLTKVNGYITVNDRQTFFKDYSPAVEGVHRFSTNTSLFEVERDSSYRCNTKTTITNFNTTKNFTVTSIELENLRIESFIDESKAFDTYGVEKVCSADIDKNSNVIPIIVGACLAVLVVIVLVAYLIGRRRNRNGYQSV